MKKITLSIALLIGVLTSSAQDTICTMVRLHEVINFNHNPTEIISRYYKNEDVFIFIHIHFRNNLIPLLILILVLSSQALFRAFTKI